MSSAELIVGSGFTRPGSDKVFDIAADAGDGLSVFLADQAALGQDPQNQWIIEISAKLERSYSYVGRVLTTPPKENVEPMTRLIAIANVPGAIAWQVTARGRMGQKANLALASGHGVGNGCPGIYPARPRPRDYFRGNSRIAAPFDVVLLGLYVSDTSTAANPNPGDFVQFFNQPTLPNPGTVPIFERRLAVGGAFDLLFDAGNELGDPRFTQGLSWALSSTPGLYTPVANVVISVDAVLG